MGDDGHQSNELSQRAVQLLERMNMLLAMSVVRDLPLREQVMSLDLVGYAPREIAEIIRKTPNHISVILHELRRKSKEEGEPGNQAPPNPSVPPGGT